MPLIARQHTLPLDADTSARLQRFEPTFALQPPSADAQLYIGWFNEKPICAAWAIGASSVRQLQGFAIHPATRGRGVLAQLAQAMRLQERSAGACVLSTDDYELLDR